MLTLPQIEGNDDIKDSSAFAKRLRRGRERIVGGSSRPFNVMEREDIEY